jgi:hypothetical protein
MDPVYEQLPPDTAMEVQQVARLIYETRENRRTVLAAVGATDDAGLLERITSGDIAEHPAYEHYLAARILGETHEDLRRFMAETLQEVNRR